jgi:hypothetical protein
MRVRIIYQLRMRARVALAVVVAELRYAASAMIYRAGEWPALRPRRRRP